MEIREPLVELRSTRLFQRLVELDAALAEKAAHFLKVVAPILATTATHFPYYTRHDAHHGFRVLRRIEQVVVPGCLHGQGIEEFGAAEIYLLILAAYAHDLGMTVFPGEADQLLAQLGIANESGWETDGRLQSHLRREHSRRGGRYIHMQSSSLSVPVNLVDALDKIMRAHNLSIDVLEGEIPAAYAAEERLIDVRQLAVIICVADALEFSDTRVVDGVLAAIAEDPSPEARVSYIENMKHVCVGDSLAIDSDGRVNVSGTFEKAEVLALAHRTLDEMEGWIRGYCDIDRRMMAPRLRIRPEPFARNLAFPGGRFERLGVRLNKRNVIALIASNAIWRESGPVIRELLQNAVEACRYRRHHSSEADAYQPAVSVVFDRSRHEIMVEDNGCGMTERVILNNLLTVGSSRSAEPGYSTTGYAPIARFGVGFWSVFTLAKTAYVETASFEPHRGDPNGAIEARGTAFDVSLDELKEYTVFSPVTRPCGTKVRLKLRDDVVIDDTFTSACAQILCSEVPVTLRLDEERVTVPPVVPDVPLEALLGSRHRALEEHGIRLFEWRNSFGNTELSLLLAYRIENGRPTFLLNPTSSLMTALGHSRRPRTTVCGFPAPIRERHICFDLDRVGIYFANRLTPQGISYSLDRNQLVESASSEEFSREVTRLIHDGYRAFLDETNGLELATVTALRQQAAMHGGNVFDVYTGNELQVASERHPDLMPFKFHPLSGEGPLYAKADELPALKGKVFFMQQRPIAKMPDGRLISLENEGEASLSLVKGLLAGLFSAAEPIYVMESDRSASMLFDADPDSSVLYVTVPQFGHLCLQMVQLERVDTHQPGKVLADVRGRWTGTLYLRDFEAPNAKPYVFLGRHRVLINRSSPLARHFQDLADNGRDAKLASLVADLQEDQEGYTPPSVADLLSARSS
ncbi:HD domain-containing protein [Palleronia abyssalis]|uniref:Chaperone protein HtpG n=1 Tax=Palleronia abyssalis TaxID=1501240 RepID=A0A2R8BYY0_9RHOB|nr:ATP-binding protein [Palleronia abyssalis]SPJ25377.1 Chaperone protein HtpG [Palleronia abyssalis]